MLNAAVFVLFQEINSSTAEFSTFKVLKLKMHLFWSKLHLLTFLHLVTNVLLLVQYFIFTSFAQYICPRELARRSKVHPVLAEGDGCQGLEM